VKNTLRFPDHFEFGTSTASYQIETAVGHDWLGVRSRDGNVFGRTTDHETRHDEDVKIIASLAPNYRMSLMWSKLQLAPLADLNIAAVNEYKSLFEKLTSANVKIMLVLHHFANPIWFAKLGGWEKETNIFLWLDYVRKVVSVFGKYVTSYNTFNEPNLYTSLGWVIAEFPPFKRNIFTARHVIRNMGKAHALAYQMIKNEDVTTQVGISHNSTLFEPHNLLGKIPAKFFDWCFMEYPPSLFQPVDFFGLSYYARITFDPFAVTYLNSPAKIESRNKPHDDMWEYYPQGLSRCIKRYWNQYKKPIIITENGICTSNDSQRIRAIEDYMIEINACLNDAIPVKGYYHWTAWDNFEWSLGPTFQFGLYVCDLNSKERRKKPSADFFSRLAHTNEVIVEGRSVRA
jgi:beta-glucosidase